MGNNADRVKEELKALGAEYKSILERFKYVTLPFMKTRVPQSKQDEGFPDNNELFHLLTAFIEELFDQAPRCCAYVTIAGLLGWGGYQVYLYV